MCVKRLKVSLFLEKLFIYLFIFKLRQKTKRKKETAVKLESNIEFLILSLFATFSIKLKHASHIHIS